MPTIVELDKRSAQREALSPEEEQLAFYYWVGIAILQWATVERELCFLIARCAADKDRELMVNGFFSIENFRSKLKFADTVMQARYGQTKHIEDWKRLHERLASRSAMRNSIAHQKATMFLGNRAGRRFGLTTWLKKEAKAGRSSKQPGKQAAPGTLFLRDVTHYQGEFYALMATISNFASRIGGFKESFEKSAETAGTPPSLKQIRYDIRRIVDSEPRAPRRRNQSK